MTLRVGSLLLWFLTSSIAAQVLDVKVPPTESADSESNGFAIVVGVDTYKDPQLDKLSYAVKDAEAVAAWLRAEGWTVSLMRSSDTDAALRPDDVETLLNEVRFVASRAKRKDRLLFYFSGHGFQVGNENYVCVSDTRHDDPATALSQTRILEAFTAGQSVKKAVILDACRVAPGGRNLLKGFTLKELEDARGIWHLYSAAPGFKSFEPAAGTQLDGEVVANGFFTHFLLKGLKGEAETNGDGFVTLVELSLYVEEVMGLASVERKISRQVPYLLWDGQVNGDFLLGKAGRLARRVPERPRSTESASEALGPLRLTLEAPTVDARLERGSDVEFRGRVEGGQEEILVHVNGVRAVVREGRWSHVLRIPEEGKEFLLKVEGREEGRRVAPPLEVRFSVTEAGVDSRVRLLQAMKEDDVKLVLELLPGISEFWPTAIFDLINAPPAWGYHSFSDRVVIPILACPDLDPNEGSRGSNPLLIACYSQNYRAVRALLERDDIDVNPRASLGGGGPIHQWLGAAPVHLGRTDLDMRILSALLARKDLDVSILDGEGRTAREKIEAFIGELEEKEYLRGRRALPMLRRAASLIRAKEGG